MAMSLVACGDKVDTGKETETTNNSNFFKEETPISAFKDFYNNYCEEHYCEITHDIYHDENLSYGHDIDLSDKELDIVPYLDCGAKIEICEGSYLLIIADLVDIKLNDMALDSEDEGNYRNPIFDLSIYKYDDGVKELCIIEKIEGNDEGGIKVSNLDDCIIVCADRYYSIQISDGSYKEISEEGNDNINEHLLWYLDNYAGATDYLVSADDGAPAMSDVMNGEKFEAWLDYLDTQEYGNSFELNYIYAKYLCDNHIVGSFLKDMYEVWGYSLDDEEVLESILTRPYKIELVFWQNGVLYQYCDNELLLYSDCMSEEMLNDYINQNSTDTDVQAKTCVVLYGEPDAVIEEKINDVDIQGQLITNDARATADDIRWAIQSTLASDEVYDDFKAYFNTIISFEEFDELPDVFKNKYLELGEVPDLINSKCTYAFEITSDNQIKMYIALRDLSKTMDLSDYENDIFTFE